MNISTETRERYNEIANQEFKAHLGKLLKVEYLCGYSDNDSADVACEAIVRVVPTPETDILHWNDEWLDPYWDVELIEGDERARSLRSIWIDGPSHNALTGKREWRAEVVSLIGGQS
jgi:hypothetical protein